MAWEREELCVGCAECVGCYRKNQWWMQCYCDNCGEAITDIGFNVDEQELCHFCTAEYLFNKYAKPDIRDTIRVKMEDEGYDVSEMDDVIEYFNIPYDDQPDRFDVTETEEEEDYNYWDDRY